MTNYAGIQAKIDRGKGKAAAKIGQPYTVYRLEAGSNGDYPDGWTTVAENVHVFRRRLKSERDIESATANATMFYDIVGDMTDFILGDTFLQTDPPYVPGISYGLGATQVEGQQFDAFTFAWHPPVRKAVGARVDRRVRIYRPAVAPKRLTDGSLYWETTHPGDQPFILQNGQMVLGSPGQSGSFVPGGLVSAYRPYGPLPFRPSPPGMVRPTHWHCYLPPLPGYTPREGDAVISEDDARYVIVDPFFQTAGVVGSQILLDREVAQAT